MSPRHRRVRFAHLTLAEREIIRRLLGQKHSHAAIARILGKNRATVSREIRRNTNEAGIYYEKHAHVRMLLDVAMAHVQHTELVHHHGEEQP